MYILREKKKTLSYKSKLVEEKNYQREQFERMIVPEIETSR